MPEIPIGTAEGLRPPPLAGTLATGEPYALPATPSTETVLVFYRSAQCGLCRLQLQELEANLPAYRQQGVEVVGVTLDPAEVSRALAEQMPLSIPVVSVDSATFEAWDALDADRRRPLPATYIVDRSGVVRFRHIGRNASDRTTDAGVLTVLQRISRE